MNGSVSGPASSGRSATAVAVSEPADSSAESSWLARAGASEALRAPDRPPPWAAVAFAELAGGAARAEPPCCGARRRTGAAVAGRTGAAAAGADGGGVAGAAGRRELGHLRRAAPARAPGA